MEIDKLTRIARINIYVLFERFVFINEIRMKTILMAGGRGTRIAELFPNIPKPLIPVAGMPILEERIRSLCGKVLKISF